jgi:acetyl/propionyl-CoA carboxylase alpha subunit
LYFPSIESMKMETVIRSPQKGVVAKLVHKEGVSWLPSYSFTFI